MFTVFMVLKAIGMFASRRKKSKQGLDISEHGMHAYPSDAIVGGSRQLIVRQDRRTESTNRSPVAVRTAFRIGGGVPGSADTSCQPISRLLPGPGDAPLGQASASLGPSWGFLSCL